MAQPIEAIYLNGAIKPLQPVTFQEAEHLVILRLADETSPTRCVRGAMKGRLSSVDQFIKAKQVEIALENNE